MKSLFGRFATLTLVLAVAVGTAVTTAPAASQTLAPEERARVDRVEASLNAIDTLRARFVQASDDGAVAEGTLYLDRPGKLRIEYDPPVPYLYVADGIFLVFYDTELDQRSQTLLRATLAGFLARDEIGFDDDIQAIGARRIGGLVEVDVVERDDPDGARLTVLFDGRGDGLVLAGWSIMDAHGLTTQVSLVDPVFGLELDAALFHAPTPDWEHDDD